MIEVLNEIKKETKIETEPYKEPLTSIENQVNVILVLVNNSAFKTKIKPFNLKIFGKSMIEWVSNAVQGMPLSKVECAINEDILPIIKTMANVNYKYTLVLYSDAPLLQRKTVLEILEYVRFKQPSVLKLTRGYVFETEYLTKIDKLYAPQTQYFEEEDFITCYNLKQFSIVSEIFKNRILSFHLKNGVQILDLNQTYIDADVQIGSNVVIYPNNHLIGKTTIGDDVVLLMDNKIENSVVLELTQIEKSVLTNSIIKNNCKILPFNTIYNKSIVEEGVIVNSFCVLDGVKVEKLTVVPSFSNLKK